jgi:hypothetical protein
MKKIITIQFYVLLLGTLFAWANFAYELKNWLNNQANPLGCVPGITNPFLTPCFYGALFFTLAFVLSVILLKKSKKVV